VKKKKKKERKQTSACTKTEHIGVFFRLPDMFVPKLQYMPLSH